MDVLMWLGITQTFWIYSLKTTKLDWEILSASQSGKTETKEKAVAIKHSQPYAGEGM